MVFGGKLNCSGCDGHPRDVGAPSSPAIAASALPTSVRPKLSNRIPLPDLQNVGNSIVR